MSEKLWRASAPSNIALIKYMGKTEIGGNKPANASLSYTLNHLETRVEIEKCDAAADDWQALVADDVEPVTLSESGREKFLRHFDFLKSELGIKGHYRLRSANTFPSDCGLASSASAFAALTRAAHAVALSEGTRREEVEAMTAADLSRLSRRGSGSSCRSFFSPWALWRDEGAEELKLPLTFLHHLAVLLETGKKTVSSSEAHKKVAMSELFQGRPTRAEHRLKELLEALNLQDWRRAFEFVWADFWDMHALFETSRPPFGYMSAKSLKVLEVVREVWADRGDGPLATMDAGANVHLMFRPDQAKVARWMADEFSSMGRVLEGPELRREVVR